MFGFATTEVRQVREEYLQGERTEFEGPSLDYKMISVQCTYCKTPIGIIDDNNRSPATAASADIAC